MNYIKKENTRKFSFGKIDYYGIGRKINAVEVNFSLLEKNDGSFGFRASCSVWNSKNTDIVAGGQILDADELLSIEANNILFKAIKELWQKYHLNDTHAGTFEQEEALRAAAGKFDIYDFDQACKYLKSIGLYEVEYEGKPYRYGSGWINYPIPKDDLDKIFFILNNPPYKVEEYFEATK